MFTPLIRKILSIGAGLLIILGGVYLLLGAFHAGAVVSVTRLIGGLFVVVFGIVLVVKVVKAQINS